jgi:hypothetical protein
MIAEIATGTMITNIIIFVSAFISFFAVIAIGFLLTRTVNNLVIFDF